MQGKPYREFKQLDLPAIAGEVLGRWDREDTFGQSIGSRRGGKPFVFYEGPPSANGLPGIHHVMARTIKDLFCRYKTLRGYQVHRKGGWDTHGLPIELGVEKTLGITKDDIGKTITVEAYNKACRSEVMKYKNAWDDLTRKMGYWVDLDHPYITFENDYIETCWFLLKTLYDKNLLYKGLTIQPYSPAAGTGLSSHELNMPGSYRPLKDTSVVAQFRATAASLKQLPEGSWDDGVFFIAWTTTPWTLPANCALAVGADIEYVIVRTFNPYTALPVNLVLAADRLTAWFDEKNAGLPMEGYAAGDKAVPYRVVGRTTGKALEGMTYEQLMPYVQPEGRAFVVITGDFVTTDEGTGIVHTASVFGADDFRLCNEKGISSVLVKDENGRPTPLVDKHGRFVKEVTDFAGEYVKEQYYTAEEKEAERLRQGGKKYLSVDERIAIRLKRENKAFRVEKYEHSYPHCWRTDKPVLYYPLDSWFIRTTAYRDRMVELNKTINWKPESTGTGRFGNWLENLVDWNLSRSRFWGIPLPVWRTEDKTEERCIGSVDELKREIEKAVRAGVMDASHLEHLDPAKQDFDLHRPYIDSVVLVSSAGKPMMREPDLIDVWFDSGAMPYAQWHYMGGSDQAPFGKTAAFPADFIAEGVDQTRGWFFTLHALAVMLFDSVAFRNVVSNGLVLDREGNKMSKRLGNVVDPFRTIEKYGPDATRWYLMSNSQPWDNLRFNAEGIAEVQRKLFGTLYNAYSFFALYANIDRYVPAPHGAVPVPERQELDRWIVSRMHSLVRQVCDAYDAYEPTRAARAIESFVDEHLSNWYIRLSRRRFWKSEMSADKQAAYDTLYECLRSVAQLMSPIAPFFSDWLYRNLQAGDGEVTSVHVSHLDAEGATCIDEALEARMDLAQQVSSMVLSLRKKVNIRVRQPLNRIVVPLLDPDLKSRLESVRSLVLAEVNVKDIEYISDTHGVLVKKIKANYKTLGKRLGPLMKKTAEAIQAMSQEDIARFEADRKYEIAIDGTPVTLSADDVEITSEDMPGWVVKTQGPLSVALDVHISDALREEGLTRELINRVQNLRKDKGFSVTDRIAVKLEKHDGIAPAVQNNLPYICAEILAGSFEWADSLDGSAADEIEVDDDIKTLISIERI